MPVTWKDYVGLRGLNEKEYFENHQISSYEQLLSLIDKRDVVPPKSSDIQAYLVAPPAKKQALKEKSSSQKIDISKRSKSTTRRSVKKKSPLKT
jgi:hypothetical protein